MRATTTILAVTVLLAVPLLAADAAVDDLVIEAKDHVHDYSQTPADSIGGVIEKALAGVTTARELPEEIGGVEDHVHLLLGLRATHCLADVVREIKKASSRWVHEKIKRPAFAWQEGYGAFTVSRSNIAAVRKYIAGQVEHHARHTFRDEYRGLLTKHEIEFDERFLW